ncbi:hypothetical protein ACJJTC_012608 [Scirpophaga incertulas]
MDIELRSSKKDIFLVGNIKHMITGAKLPSNRQVLAVFFYNIREVGLKVNESANLRKPGRQGCLAGVDQKLAEKEERVRQRNLIEENRRLKYESVSEFSSTCYNLPTQNPTSSIHGLSDGSADSENEFLPDEPVPLMIKLTVQRGRKNFVTPKLVATLDRCQLSTRDSVYVLQAAIEALGLNSADYPVKSSIQRIRTKARKQLERELLLFACRHHVYELVLNSVFEAKIPQVTRSPDIPFFKKFKDNWKNIDLSSMH